MTVLAPCKQQILPVRQGLARDLHDIGKRDACSEVQSRRGVSSRSVGAYGVVGFRALKTPEERPPLPRLAAEAGFWRAFRRKTPKGKLNASTWRAFRKQKGSRWIAIR